MRLGCESDKGGAAATAALKTMGLAAVPALAAALTASLLPEAGAKGPWGPVGGDEHNRAVQRAVELLAAALRPMSSLRPEHARLLQPPLREGLPHWRRVTGTLSRLPREVREPLRQVVSASQRLAA